MKATNRRWQNHLRAKGPIPFFLDRLQSHVFSTGWQFGNGSFHFPIIDRERDDELTKAYFEMTERFPYEFHIELTNHCNLNCKMCARPSMTRTKGFMTNEMFKRIIDEITEKMPYAYIHYYGIGEPLVDKRLFEKLEYARSKNIVNSVLFTNGQLLDVKDNLERLANSGVAVLGVDLDGFTEEVYSRIRVGGKFSLAKSGIEKLYAYIRANHLRTRVEIAYQVYPGINEQDIPPFIEWCEQYDYEYKLVNMHTWGGLRDDIPASDLNGLEDMHHKTRTGPCPALWNCFFIAWDGRVALCFADADLREVMGDVNSESIEDIWTGKHLGKRRKHLDGIYDGLCAGCSSQSAIKVPAMLHPEKNTS